MTTTHRFTHIVTFTNGREPMALTGAEAVSTRRSQRNGDRPDVDRIYTRAHVEREYAHADGSVTYWWKRLRLEGVRCNWRGQDYSCAMHEAAWERMEKWERLLNVLDRAETNHMVDEWFGKQSAEVK